MFNIPACHTFTPSALFKNLRSLGLKRDAKVFLSSPLFPVLFAYRFSILSPIPIQGVESNVVIYPPVRLCGCLFTIRFGCVLFRALHWLNVSFTWAMMTTTKKGGKHIVADFPFEWGGVFCKAAAGLVKNLPPTLIKSSRNAAKQNWGEKSRSNSRSRSRSSSSCTSIDRLTFP